MLGYTCMKNILQSRADSITLNADIFTPPVMYCLEDEIGFIYSE